MLSVFAPVFFHVIVPLFLAIFQSSICLSFSWQSLENFFPEKCLLSHPKTLRSKVLSFLALRFRALLFLGFVSGGFWGVNSDFVLEQFRGVVSVG